eukprot:m.49107 g.49107  ORF g.49107 m.49107 type:complete len:101 (-) comp10860_c0_seq15:1826-2128(-)
MTNNSNIGEALLLCVSLLFVQKRKQCVHAQGKDLPQLIALLKDKMVEEEYSVLTKAQDEVYEMLTNSGGVEFNASITVDDLRALVGIEAEKKKEDENDEE